MGKKLKHFFKKPMSKKQVQDKMEEMNLEKGDIKAMIIAAFLVFAPALLLVIGIILLVIFAIF